MPGVDNGVMTDVIAGRFALCDPIARGGSGLVWRAYDRKVGRFCAAKVLRRRDAGDLLRFVREQSVRIAHPHVLTPYSWAAEDTHVVIASELADGGSLSTLIGDYGPLAETTVAALLDQILEALEHVHAGGLVHRDVKPANLLLRVTGTEPLHVMLSDFGLAIGADDAHLTQVGTVVGTPGYLPPELMRGGVPPEPRHDLFAAGRVAVALLCGSEPGGLASVAPQASPGPLRDVVTALTSIDVCRRPSSASEARAALRQALTDRRPRTLGGEQVDVLHQLPPLSDEALTEAGAAPTKPLVATPARAVPVAVRLTHAPSAALPHRRRPRRGLLTAALGVAAAVTVGVPLAFALNGASPGVGHSSTTPPGKQPPKSTGAPSTSSGGTVDQAVEVGATCSWQEEGDHVRATSGTQVVCTRTANRGYVWSKS